MDWKRKNNINLAANLFFGKKTSHRRFVYDSTSFLPPKRRYPSKLMLFSQSQIPNDKYRVCSFNTIFFFGICYLEFQ